MEENQYTNPELQGYQDEEVEIDWTGIFAKLLKGWKFIVLVTFIFGCLGIFFALNMKRKYACTVTLAPELQRRSTSINNITSMLGLGDISLGSNSDAMSITLFPDICQSTPFLTGLFDVELTPYVDPEVGGTATPVTLFDHMMGKDRPAKNAKKQAEMEEALAEYSKYYDDSVVDVSALTPNQASVVNALKQLISANVDQKTGKTQINVTFDDKAMVAQLADTVTTRLQKYVSEYRTRKAIQDYEYYSELADEAKRDMVKAQQAYAARVDYDRSVILQSVNSEKERLQQEVSLSNQLYSQMAQQRQMAKAKIQEEKPMYAVIQPATQPQYPVNSRKKVVLIWGFLGGVLSCAWVAFGRDLWKKLRGGVKEKIAEEKAEEQAEKAAKEDAAQA